MIDFLELLLNSRSIETHVGETSDFQWEYWGEGLLVFSPTAGYNKSVIISAGIHGNETAPIELLAQITHDLFLGQLKLNVRLMCILGNPSAIRAGQRYIENDVNRMFDGGYQHLPVNSETLRAAELEQVVQRFVQHTDPQANLYHFDLHTAIRPSLLPTFALFPYQSHAYDEYVLQCLSAANLDAVVFHNALGHTFSHFTSYTLQVASVTLELGQAKAFGQNDLNQFQDIDTVLRAVIEAQPLAPRTQPRLRQFKVVDSILKSSEDFELQVDEDVANFTIFEQGQVIARQGCLADESQTSIHSQDYVVCQPQVWLLFPNAKVKIGLRAGLILEEI